MVYPKTNADMDYLRFLTTICLVSVCCGAKAQSAIDTAALAYPFALIDTAGDTVRLEDFSGKAVVIDFWYTGCTGCAYFYRNWLKHIEAHFNGRDDLVFVSIAVDRDREQWLGSVEQGIYSSSHAVNLYVGPERFNHPLLRHHGIDRFPHLLVVDPDGRAAISVWGPTRHTTARWIELISEVLPL